MPDDSVKQRFSTAHSLPTVFMPTATATSRDAMNRCQSELAALLGDRLITAGGALAHYAQSEAYHTAPAPDLVAKPSSIEDVQQIVRIAARHNVPVTGWGAGTSLEGNAAAIKGGIIVDFTLMNRIRAIAASDMLCVVEPGVTREQLNADLRDSGLFFPVDPGANATLGGMISTRASGTTTVRYGSMRDNVLALKVVLADGTLISTGTHARKSAAGYDLTHLFTGAEGTLGLIVEATLRLHGRPEHTVAATWNFNSAEGAINTVITTIQCGVAMTRMEFLDPAAIAACNAFSHMTLPEDPTLFLEFSGSEAEIAHQMEMVKAIGGDFGGKDFSHADTAEARNLLWRARHQALPAARALRANTVAWITDICVPISHLADAIKQAQDGIAAAGLTAPILGHVGDGNFHVFFILDPDQQDEWSKAKAVNEAMIAHALCVGGTCTGEHGIGLGKRAALLREHGDGAVNVMHKIKQALDPHTLMNPGKIFADDTK